MANREITLEPGDVLVVNGRRVGRENEPTSLVEIIWGSDDNNNYWEATSTANPQDVIFNEWEND